MKTYFCPYLVKQNCWNTVQYIAITYTATSNIPELNLHHWVLNHFLKSLFKQDLFLTEWTLWGLWCSEVSSLLVTQCFTCISRCIVMVQGDRQADGHTERFLWHCHRHLVACCWCGWGPFAAQGHESAPGRSPAAPPPPAGSGEPIPSVSPPDSPAWHTGNVQSSRHIWIVYEKISMTVAWGRRLHGAAEHIQKQTQFNLITVSVSTRNHK